MVAVRIFDAWHMCVGKQEVECDGQEGQILHQGKILIVENHLVQSVREGQPLQGVTHTVHVWVSDTHGQKVIVQTLKRKKGRMRRRRGGGSTQS